MADNTTLAAGAGGDTVRDKDRSGVKTQIVGLDINIAGPETLMSAGQQAMAASIPVVIASDQTATPVKVQPQTSGGWSVYRTLDGQPTGVSVKASVGQLGGWFLSNNNAAVRYVKLYDKATAPASTDTPLLTLLLPANSAANLLAVPGIDFAAGIGIRVTTGVADSDTGAPSANDVVVNLFYK